MVTLEELKTNIILPEFWVEPHKIKQNDVDLLRSAIENAKCEQEMQTYIFEHPYFLVEHLSGGHGRWLISQKRLGSEYITDFLIADKDSMGFHWRIVELKKPISLMFNQKGYLSADLNKAICQICYSRVWLEKNIDYASRLGLESIDGKIPGIIIIGRQESVNKNIIQGIVTTDELRNRIGCDLNIEIHTYDWLLDMAQRMVEFETK